MRDLVSEVRSARHACSHQVYLRNVLVMGQIVSGGARGVSVQSQNPTIPEYPANGFSRSGEHTKNMLKALLLLASVFFFPNVMSFSASRCASLALGNVVDIDSCVKRDVTRFRRRACLCDDLRPRWRYFNRAPAILENGTESKKNDNPSLGIVEYSGKAYKLELIWCGRWPSCSVDFLEI